jgi:hypothetical protein
VPQNDNQGAIKKRRSNMKKMKNFMVVHRDPDVSWESILEVEETIPDIWVRKYQEQMEAEDREDTTTSSKRLAREGTL